MRVNDSEFLISKALIVIKIIYWVWLFLCFTPWLNLALNVLNLDDQMPYNFLRFVTGYFIYENNFGGYLFYSSYFTPIVFIIISIARRKVSVWEFSIVAATWCLIFYTFPHLRG